MRWQIRYRTEPICDKAATTRVRLHAISRFTRKDDGGSFVGRSGVVVLVSRRAQINAVTRAMRRNPMQTSHAELSFLRDDQR